MSGDGSGVTVCFADSFGFSDGDVIDILSVVGESGENTRFSGGNTVDSAAAVHRDHRFVVAFP